MLFAAIREGAGSFILDNLVAPLGGAPINQFLTEPRYSGRILGQSENDTLPNTTMFLCTGNNVAFLGDTCRRVMVCRIDAAMEQPYLREFAFDPMAFVQAERARLVVAALTIIRAYLHAAPQERPATGRLASFEPWDDLVRQTVCWIAKQQDGIPLADPKCSIDVNHAADPHKSMLAAVFTAWQQTFGRRAVTAKEVLDASMGAFGDNPLADALEEVAAQGSGQLTAKRLGWWLKRHQGEYAGGLRVMQIPNQKLGAKWQVNP